MNHFDDFKTFLIHPYTNWSDENLKHTMSSFNKTPDLESKELQVQTLIEGGLTV